VLADKYKDVIDWNNVNFFWVDERCVPPDEIESNYGMTKKILLNNISIPDSNVNRMKGEDNPESEATLYSQLLKKRLPSRNGYPEFDLIILGMGNDGHTASIFPDQMYLLNADEVCAVARQPQTGQKRITITGKVINNAERVFFIVNGEGKSKVLNEVLEKEGDYMKYPASHVQPEDGVLKWSITNYKL